jgi:hypothetical protein
LIVLLAGMPRSGSTFSFNIVREVLSRRGRVYHETGPDVPGVVNRSEGADHVLVKAHSFDGPSLELARAGAFRVLMTIRRVEDALASWLEIFDPLPEEVALQVMRDWLTLYRQLRAISVVVSYEEIDRWPWLAAWRIARATCPDVGLIEVMRIAQRFRKAEVKRQADTMLLGEPGEIAANDFSYYDTTTLFHRRHVSSLRSRPAEKRLDRVQLAHIREVLWADIEAAGLA